MGCQKRAMADSAGRPRREILGAGLGRLAAGAAETDPWPSLLAGAGRNDGAPLDGQDRRVDGSRPPVAILARPAGRGRTRRRAAVKRGFRSSRGLAWSVLAAMDEERRRIGRKFHDGMAQNLTCIALLCEAAMPSTPSGSSPEQARILMDLAALVAQVNAQARDLLRLLMLAEPRDLDLPAALRRLAERIPAASGIALDVEAADGLRNPDRGTVISLFQIAQEAVDNAVRHSGTRRILLSLKRVAGGIELAVRDDGRGLGRGERFPAAGLGMRLMRLRARLIGAPLHIAPRRPRGTEVRCLLPWPLKAASR